MELTKLTAKIYRESDQSRSYFSPKSRQCMKGEMPEAITPEIPELQGRGRVLADSDHATLFDKVRYENFKCARCARDCVILLETWSIYRPFFPESGESFADMAVS